MLFHWDVSSVQSMSYFPNNTKTFEGWQQQTVIWKWNVLSLIFYSSVKMANPGFPAFDLWGHMILIFDHLWLRPNSNKENCWSHYNFLTVFFLMYLNKQTNWLNNLMFEHYWYHIENIFVLAQKVKFYMKNCIKWQQLYDIITFLLSDGSISDDLIANCLKLQVKTARHCSD